MCCSKTEQTLNKDNGNCADSKLKAQTFNYSYSLFLVSGSTWTYEMCTSNNTGSKVPSVERRRFHGLVIYTFWNLWKERNRRIFNNATETALQVAMIIKEDIDLRKRAFS